MLGVTDHTHQHGELHKLVTNMGLASPRTVQQMGVGLMGVVS